MIYYFLRNLFYSTLIHFVYWIKNTPEEDKDLGDQKRFWPKKRR